MKSKRNIIILIVLNIVIFVIAVIACFYESDIGLYVAVLSLYFFIYNMSLEIIVKKELEDITKVVNHLKKKVDFESSVEHYENMKEISQKYLEITHKVFLSYKDDIIKKTKEELSDLWLTKTTYKLPKDIYYSLLDDQFAKSKKGSVIIAISLMQEGEWDMSLSSEENYLQLNIDTSERGIEVKRYFITTPELMKTYENNKAIKAHLDKRYNNLKGFFINYNELDRNGLLPNVSKGFVLFNNSLMMDYFNDEGDERGYCSVHEDRIKECQNTSDLIIRHSKDLEKVIDNNINI